MRYALTRYRIVPREACPLAVSHHLETTALVTVMRTAADRGAGGEMSTRAHTCGQGGRAALGRQFGCRVRTGSREVLLASSPPEAQSTYPLPTCALETACFQRRFPPPPPLAYLHTAVACRQGLPPIAIPPIPDGASSSSEATSSPSSSSSSSPGLAFLAFFPLPLTWACQCGERVRCGVI